MKKIGLSSSVAVLALAPVVALAQFGGINDFLGNVILFINDVLVPLVFAVALLVFLWGVFNYFILGGGDESKREQGRSLMLYAIIGFVLMITIFGIVNLISSGLGLNDEDIETMPNTSQTNT